MKRLTLLLCALLLCTSCAALPAEERAFAVALCVEKAEDWRVYGRIPTYQSGGGYLTVTGAGDTFSAALADMDASAPMHLSFAHLRLLAMDAALAETGEVPTILAALAERSDMRMQCALALTDAPLSAVSEALVPAAGARLSKALDLMLEARIEQGTILPATLADVLRMGERQSPVLIVLALEGEELTLSGGYTLTGLRLTARETALLSLVLGEAKSLRLTLAEDAAELRDASVQISLSEDFAVASVALTVRTTAASLTSDGLEQALASELAALLSRLSADGCDVLGLGRKAILRADNMAHWHAIAWPQRYRTLRWEVSVGVRGPA